MSAINRINLAARIGMIALAVMRALVISAAFSTAAMAAELSWVLPTTRVNGVALQPSELAGVKIYKQGAAAAIATVPTSQLTYTVPDCTSAIYYATAVDTGGLESTNSNTAANTPLAVNCAPKPPTAVQIK